MLERLYWCLVLLLLGGCIGSFLNVVIYRWPRGLSVRRPSRSFCPHCGKAIAWYDNIPVVSFLWLRGTCRHCGNGISLQYPLIELVTAAIFLMSYDVLLVARQRIGFTSMAADWPMLTAHLALGAGLIVLTVMDLEAYIVDIRVTWIVAAVGLLGHAFWTPAGSVGWVRPGPTQAVMMWAAAVGLLLSFAWDWLRNWRSQKSSASEFPQHSETPEDLDVDSNTASQEGSKWAPSRFQRWAIFVALLVVVGYMTWMATQPAAPIPTVRSFDRVVFDGEPVSLVASRQPWNEGAGRLVVMLAMIFVVLTLAASCPHEEADTEIVEAIQEERIYARQMAVRELFKLAPAIVLAMGAWWGMHANPSAAGSVFRLLNWHPWEGNWRPILGLSTALAGWIIGGGIAWFARIGFTLLFGKEALGMGDVHILAATGAVAGWLVALLGFFVAAPLALAAWLVIRLRRQAWAMPYGPWLALAFLVVIIFQDRILGFLGVRWML